MQRENGLYTYFASDIAYHLNKYERGFDQVINIWGADHHGYIPGQGRHRRPRPRSPGKLEVALSSSPCSTATARRLRCPPAPVNSSPCANWRGEVGNDACRFFYALRKSDQHLDFDLDLAKSQTNENPVYYIQYAHARISSVIGQWGGKLADLAKQADLGRLDNPRELALANKLAEFADIVNAAARDLAPHQIAFYLKDLAGEFHGWYNAERMLVEDEALRDARIALAAAVRQVIRNGMALLGVTCPESM